MAMPWCQDTTRGLDPLVGKGSSSRRHDWKTFLAPRALDIHSMVMKAVGDWPIGLAIVLADG